MRSLLFIVTALLFSFTGAAQDTVHARSRTIWCVPSRAENISGMALGFIGSPTGDRSPKHVQVTGIYIDAGFIGLLFMPYMIYGSLGSIVNKDSVTEVGHIALGKNYFRPNDTVRASIHGLTVTPGTLLSDYELRGISVIGLYSQAVRSRGIVISGFMNDMYEFRGVAIAGVRNKSAKGKGLQIGLFNNCNELKGLQIGLWNRTSKRSLPVINWGT